MIARWDAIGLSGSLYLLEEASIRLWIQQALEAARMLVNQSHHNILRTKKYNLKL